MSVLYAISVYESESHLNMFIANVKLHFFLIIHKRSSVYAVTLLYM